MMDPVAKLLLDYLGKVIDDPGHAVLDLQELPEGFHDLGKGLLYFAECILETRSLAKAISKGNLDIDLPPAGNELAAPLKDLHAALKHLTWQTQQVAKGDYQQRVDFMGDFSQAFNSMTDLLEQRRAALLQEIENWQRENNVLVQKKSLYELLVGEIPQWIIVTDADTSEWLFISRDIDENLTSSSCKAQLRQWLKKKTKVMQGQKEVCITDLELSNTAEIRYYSVSIHPLHWHQRNALAFVLTDISKEKEQLTSLQNIANYDTLTKVYNRHYGMETLDKWLLENRSFILCFTDIDNLKLVNDLLGHWEGDQYIIRVSNILREFSPDAVLSRIGGDEFMLLAENWSVEAARERLETLRKRLSSHNDNPDIGYEQSISYGLISIEDNNILLAGDLLSAADEKMYDYKREYKRKYKKRSK